jgi:hypothetical protein
LVSEFSHKEAQNRSSHKKAQKPQKFLRRAFVISVPFCGQSSFVPFCGRSEKIN